MPLAPLDYAVFAVYLLALSLVVWYVSRRERDSVDYFLAGRNLSWWVIGCSLVASNISTEHFVGMAGSGFDVGLAIAAYEWMAAVTLVLVGRWFLPIFLRHGVYTMPEYLALRYAPAVRTVFAAVMVLNFVFIALATVLYSGGLALQEIFGLRWYYGVAILGLIGGAYTVWGGLAAAVYTDVVHLIFLLAGGVVAVWIGLREVGGFAALAAAEPERFDAIQPADHPDLPWVGVFFGGLWVANFFYWGCNQYIVQGTLGAKSLAEGQRGILMAALLKLAVPFLVVIPGIVAFHLYGDGLANKDMAYPHLIVQLLPAGLAGLMLAALLGAVLSSVDSMTNSASTIFTMDLYAKLRGADRERDARELLRVGRWATAAILLAAALWTPLVARAGGVFGYIQEAWGFFTPGVLAAFVLGFVWRGATATGALAAMLLSIPLSFALKFAWPELAFLNRMALVFLAAVLTILACGRRAAPVPAVSIPIAPVDLTPARGYWWGGGLVFAAVAALYWYFR